jgi:salicylate hydroxylase
VPRALVVGAGVGGLSAALALGEAGFTVSVFERGKTISELGAGLQLTPNATRALGKLGALEAVAAAAFAPEAIVIQRGRDGSQIARLPLADAERRWGAPYLALHRGDLQAALLKTVLKAHKTQFTLEREAVGVASDGETVALGLKRGLLSLSERGDALVGADGLWSKMRERLGLGGPQDVNPLGLTAFRAQVPYAEAREGWLKPEVVLSLAPNAHLVRYPLPARQVVNVIGVVRQAASLARGGGYDAEVSGDDMRRRFAGWNEDALALLEAADAWRAWTLFDRPPATAYATGRIALLGDAAHPMAPFLAQGAGMAIEDAATLLESLRGAPDVPAGFAAYSVARAARTGRVQQEARKQGDIYHHRGFMAFARNTTMRLLGPKRLLARYDWLYGG